MSEDELASIEDSHVVSSSYEWLGVAVDARNTQLGPRIVVRSYHSLSHRSNSFASRQLV